MTPWFIKHMRKVRVARLPQAEKHVLLVMATYCNKQGTCHPAAKTLGEQTGMTEKHVRTLLRKLRKKKVIMPVGTGDRGTTKYLIAALRNDMGTHDMGTHDDDATPTHDVGAAPTHDVGTEGAMEGAIEKDPPTSPRAGGIDRLVKVMAGQLAEYGPDGWNPDDPVMIDHAARICSKQLKMPARKRWVEQAMRIALAQYRGEA